MTGSSNCPSSYNKFKSNSMISYNTRKIDCKTGKIARITKSYRRESVNRIKVNRLCRYKKSSQQINKI